MTGLLLFLIISIAFSGCARKEVCIPAEYSSVPPPPPAAYSPPPAPTAAPEQNVPYLATMPERKGQDRRESESSTSTAPARKKAPAQPAPKTAKKPQPQAAKKQETAKSPQRQASMQQVSLGKEQLERGKSDAAIRKFEEAVRIDSGNGEAFILLARAWKQKGEKRKALEFAKKAELLYHKQPAKLKEVFLLESELYREMGERTKAGHSQKKASTVRQKSSEEPGAD